MASRKAKRRTDPAAPKPGSGLMDLAFDLADQLGDDDAAFGGGSGGGLDELDADAVLGGGPAASAPAPALAPAPAATPGPAETPMDVAGNLVAEMQRRIGELQAWTEQNAADLDRRKAAVEAAEAELSERRRALEAEEQKTAHDRERFARYRAAELDKLSDLAEKAEADAAAVAGQAENDARIVRETAAAEAEAAAESMKKEAREQILRERSTAEEKTATHRRDVEAELHRRREAIQSERTTLDREKQKLDEAGQEIEAARTELDGEWQSVLRLQRSTDALAKAWEAETARRSDATAAPTPLRLTGGQPADLVSLDADADDDAEGLGLVRFAA